MTDAIKLFAAGAVGFVSNFVLQRLVQRRVNLEHEEGSPTTFSDIPPTVTFQDLRVRNAGTAPAANVRLLLARKVVEDPTVAFKVKGDEPYQQTVNGDVAILTFARLLPKETLEVTFKSTNPLPEEFLVGIKSDEVLSGPAGHRTSKFAERALTVG